MTNWNKMMLEIVCEDDENKRKKKADEYVEAAIEVLK